MTLEELRQPAKRGYWITRTSLRLKMTWTKKKEGFEMQSVNKGQILNEPQPPWIECIARISTSQTHGFDFI